MSRNNFPSDTKLNIIVQRETYENGQKINIMKLPDPFELEEETKEEESKQTEDK